jgi:hypothetical protein
VRTDLKQVNRSQVMTAYIYIPTMCLDQSNGSIVFFAKKTFRMNETVSRKPSLCIGSIMYVGSDGRRYSLVSRPLPRPPCWAGGLTPLIDFLQVNIGRGKEFNLKNSEPAHTSSEPRLIPGLLCARDWGGGPGGAVEATRIC